MTVGQSRISQSKIRINADGALEHLLCTLKILLSKLMDQLPSLQVQVIRLNTFSFKTAEQRSFFPGQRRPQRRRDPHGNLILDGKNVFHGAIVTLSPQALAAFDLN